MNKSAGNHTLVFSNKPYVLSSAGIAGKAEGQGPFKECFDEVLQDDKLGEKSFEKGERKMFVKAVRLCAAKAQWDVKQANCLLAGDLLNQIVTAGYGARELGVPFLGLYGACSTMTESMLVGGALVDGGYLDSALCAASSHFSTAERQYRYPLEMGTTSPPSSQRTVTGTGAVLLGKEQVKGAPYAHIRLIGGTIGKVVDLGITDVNNMGAAMAPAAIAAIDAHLTATNTTPKDYDWIVTGDLGQFGSRMLNELAAEEGIDLSGKHLDCGSLIFSPHQKYHCGGSGCGCSAIMLACHFLPMLEKGEVKRVLFLSTGALMSPLSSTQGESIPGIAHVISLMHQE